MALLPDGPIDTLGYLDAALGLPERIEAELDTGPVADLVAATEIDHVYVAAPGPLGAAADLASVLAAPVAPVPVIAATGGPLPAAVSSRSLLLLVDGGDGSAPAVAEDANARGASVVRVEVDPGPVPRLTVGPALVRVLGILEQLGLFAEVSQSVDAAVAQLRRRRERLADLDAQTRLARRVGRTLPLVYGTDPLGGGAARWWRRQVNLGAKAAAFANHLPDLAADEIAGWGQHGDMTRQVFSLVVLRHDHEPAGVDAQVERMCDLVDEVVHARHVVEAEGTGSLAQLLDLMLQGDVFAHHLAQELEIDPGPVAALDLIRTRSPETT